jgi:hypothetical protein
MEFFFLRLIRLDPDNDITNEVLTYFVFRKSLELGKNFPTFEFLDENFELNNEKIN